MSQSSFVEHSVIYDASIRNLEIIGEAATHIPPEVREQLPAIDWRRIVGLRNVLIHAYPMIDDDILWDIIQNNVPNLERYLTVFLDQPETDEQS